MRKIRLYFDMFLVLMIVVGLFVSSSQPYEKQDMRGSIEQHLGGGKLEQQFDGYSLHYAGKEISTESVGFAGFLEFFIRKGVHFLTFAFLAFCLYRLLRHFCPPAIATPWSGLVSILLAILDEWHQTFTPNRTGMVADVLLDSTGVIVALLLIGCWCVISHNRNGIKGHNKLRGHQR